MLIFYIWVIACRLLNLIPQCRGVLVCHLKSNVYQISNIFIYWKHSVKNHQILANILIGQGVLDENCIDCSWLQVAVWFLKDTLIARFMEPTWGPSRADRTQVGPMLAPWTLLSRLISIFILYFKGCFDNSRFDISLKLSVILSVINKYWLSWWLGTAKQAIIRTDTDQVFWHHTMTPRGQGDNSSVT